METLTISKEALDRLLRILADVADAADAALVEETPNFEHVRALVSTARTYAAVLRESAK